ncbi:NAD binding 4, Sterile, Epimerase, 3Beta HSD, and/or RmlD sub bind domain containing protein, partial [Asbolus verrucosus]
MAQEPDRIAEIFNGRTVFITGGSGFLGQVLIEKFLRSTNVKRLYLLLRTKKNKTPQERWNAIVENMLFDPLKKQNPTALKKCHIIPGDICEDNFGISPENRLLLQNEVNFIYHSAASIRFDQSLKTAVRVNTKSIKTLLQFARECKQLLLLVHVSTSYVFHEEEVLLLGDYPNTYTYSKALAEKLVVEQMDDLPVIIVRPSIVCPTWQQPICGWINNLQNPMGLFVAAGKGILRSAYINVDCKADFVPVDCVISAIMASTWNYLNHSKQDRFINMTGPSGYIFTWNDIFETCKRINQTEVPFNWVIWYPETFTLKSKIIYKIHLYLFQMLPALFIDGILAILFQKPFFYQIQKRLHKGIEVFEKFGTKTWNFSNSTVGKIREKMNIKEMETYKMDGEGFHLRNYLKNCILSIRRNNLNEHDDTLPTAKRHLMVMWIIDFIVFKILLVSVFVFYCYKWIFSPIFEG